MRSQYLKKLMNPNSPYARFSLKFDVSQFPNTSSVATKVQVMRIPFRCRIIGAFIWSTGKGGLSSSALSIDKYTANPNSPLAATELVPYENAPDADPTLLGTVIPGLTLTKATGTVFYSVSMGTSAAIHTVANGANWVAMEGIVEENEIIGVSIPTKSASANVHNVHIVLTVIPA